MSVINLSSNSVIATILVGKGPTGLAVSPNGAAVYVANGQDATVSVISTLTNTVTATIVVGSDPLGVAFTPDGSSVYVTNQDLNRVTTINTGFTDPRTAVVATIEVDTGPNGLQVTPDGTKILVATTLSTTDSTGSVAVIDRATNTIIATIPVTPFAYTFGKFIQSGAGPASRNGKLLGQCNCSTPGEPAVGLPITVSTGNMVEQATDYQTAGQNPLNFTRHYNSQGNTAPVTTHAVSLGANWRSSYDRYLNIASATSVIAERADGQQLTFSLNGGTWISDSDVDLTLTNAGSTWTLTDHNDTIETYTAISATEAQLRTTAARNGYTQVLAYNSSNQLILVTDSYARTLSFTYTGSGLLQSLTTPDATTVTYGYTANGGGSALTSATYSTTPATTITYLYQSAVLPFALTGIIDESGNHYAAWTYESSGRALTSQLGAGANLTTLV